MKALPISLPGLAANPAEYFLSQIEFDFTEQLSVKTVLTKVNKISDIDIEVHKVSKCMFTRKEIEVIALIGGNLLDKEIASKMGISCHTLRHHKDKIYQKAGIERKSAIAQLALSLQLV